VREYRLEGEKAHEQAPEVISVCADSLVSREGDDCEPSTSSSAPEVSESARSVFSNRIV